MGGLTSVLKGVYRYIRYGSKVGKTAKNGTKVYKRGKHTTAIDKNGNVTRTTTKSKFNEYTTETRTVDYRPFGETRTGVSRVTKDKGVFESGINWSKEPFGPTKYHDWHVDPRTGKIDVRKW